MKILVLSDEESKYYWDYFKKEKLEGIDLILSCGDLKPQYLEFIATYSRAPILYVRGNHDDRYRQTPPGGCTCIEDQIYEFQGIRILGLGGSMKYKDGWNQYSQKDMEKRVKKLKRTLKKSKGFDILLTHSPAYQLGDGEDLPHQGFQSFIELMNEYEPEYFIHGHVHTNYGRQFKRIYKYRNTKIINGFERYIFEYGDNQPWQEDDLV